MLVYWIISAVLTIILFVLGWIPQATHLPFGIDGVLYYIGSWLTQIQVFLWPLQIVFQLFFFVYIPFLVVLLLLKFILGHRAPGRDIS